MVLCDKAVYFLASKKKIEFIKQVENNENDGPVPPLKFLLRDKVRPTLLVKVKISPGDSLAGEQCF